MDRSDEKLQLLICWTLRSGILVAALFAIAGGLLFFASHPPTVNFAQFLGATSPFADPATIFHLAFAPHSEPLSLRGLSLVQIGILVLLATPVLRVLFSLIGFALERDHLFFLISLAVLLVLALSIGLH